MTASLLIFGVLVLAVLGTGLVRSYAKRHLMDLPNERSSHLAPTPRGGGVAIVAAYLLGIGCAWGVGLVSTPVLVTLVGGGGVVALVGLVDDHGHVPAGIRFGCHVSAFVWTVTWIGQLPPVEFGLGPVDLGLAGTCLLVLYAVWYLNLFNFMDGIDGIAGVQALFMLCSAALLAPVPVETLLPMLLLAAATAGFLVWNWPPARIFMGDAGSGFLGFGLGSLAFWTVVEAWLTPWVWLNLGGVFLADATVTLMRRALRGERLADAHRSHAYQRLSRRLGGHRPVTLGVLALNVGWCLPWAWVAAAWPTAGAVCAIGALFPLFCAAWVLGAGLPGDIHPKA